MNYDQDEEDAFDENGVLKDGRSFRVPLMQRAIHDHAQRVKVRIHDAPLHQPGFVRDARTVEERRTIYDEYDDTVSNAWKDPATSCNGFVGSQECEPDRQGSPRDATRDARQAAYAAYDADIANAWRGAGR
jgi:hypothetical protein